MYRKHKKSLVTWLLILVMSCVNLLPVFGQPLELVDLENENEIEATWVDNTTTESAINLNPSKISHDDISIIVNYVRKDNNYEGWNLWMWDEDGNSKEVQFTEDGVDGKVAITNFNNMTDKSKIGFIVRQSTQNNEWASKDIESDRFIDLRYVNAMGEITIYLLQGDSNIYYDKVVPIIMKAELLDDFKSIEFLVNEPVLDESLIRLIDTEKSDIPVTITLNTDKLGGIIQTSSELDISVPYKVAIEGYEAIDVGINNIYSSQKFEDMYTYNGDLGAIYTPDKTTFKLWAPTAKDVKVKLYDNGTAGSELATYSMIKQDKGVWVYTLSGDLHKQYYTYEVTVGGKTVEVVDPYARAVGTNGKRGMIIDLSRTNPSGWEIDSHVTVANQTDAIIYELHVRDLSMHSDSGITNKGKYKGLIESGTKNSLGQSTGLDHIKELGVTHIHLLPVYDYLSVDESKVDIPQFNWGYDPQNYNVPEGFYSTDPSDGEVRIKEFKEMVQGLHDNDLGVIMDVVYNHLGGDGSQSNLNLIVPGYYFRMNEDGSFSNGSGCGNETASERSMMRKFMVDSVKYWAQEYNIDGFRFDLMGLHDIDTMNLIREELDKINPEIIMYGEGWTGGDTPLPESSRALKKNVANLDSRIAAFSDDIRDGLKGSVFDEKAVAFINGTTNDAEKAAESIKFGVVASTEHPQIDYSLVNYSDKAWANEPTQTVTYISAHDNHTLWDKIQISTPKATEFEQIRMDKFGAAVVLTSQGISFIHAGEEMLRTKGGDENSYKSSDSVNQLDWTRKDTYKEVFEYYKGLIELRKTHPAFRMSTTDQIKENLRFLDMPSESMVGYEINAKAVNDQWDKIVVIHNGSKQFQSVKLESKDWIQVVDSESAGTKALARYQGDTVQVTPNSTHVFVDRESYEKTAPAIEPEDITIHFKKPKAWESAYIHTWGELGNTDWPGNKMIAQKDSAGNPTGWYMYVFENAKGKKAQFVLTNSASGPQSSDLSTDKTCWIDDNFKIYNSEPSMTINVETNNDNTYLKYFKDEAEVVIKYSPDNIKTATYTLDGSNPSEGNGIEFTNNQVLRFGKDIKVGDTITLKISIDNGDMQLVKEYIYTKMEDVVIDKTPFNNLRIYQIMVASYRDGDPAKGHGIGYGPSHHHGDLKGIKEALPYIKNLGINAIWLTPIFESKAIEGQDEAADRLDSTGYFCTDYFKIDPKFGTLEEAKELVSKAHEMGIYVFLDGVFGHHKAGVDIPASPSGYKITPGKGAESSNPIFYNEETLNFYKEVASYWIDELEIDGWRLDQSYQVSIPIQDDNYWRQIREAVENKTKERKDKGYKWGTLGYMVGEDWAGEEDIQHRTYGPDFVPGLHSAFDFPGRYGLVQVLAGEEWIEDGKYNQPATKLNEIFETHKVYASHGIPNLMIGNHDLLRFGDLIQRAPHLGYGKENPDYWKRHKAAISFLASYTGPITLYYGEEIGMECDGYVDREDTIEGHVVADDNISRMPGRIPLDGTFTEQEQDLHDYTQKLMKLRSENPALWNGNRTHLFSTMTKYADLKEHGNNKVIYLLNTGTSQESFQLQESQIGKVVLIDGLTGEKISSSGGKYTIPVDGLSARFLLITQKSSGSEPSSSSSSSGSRGSSSGSTGGTTKPATPATPVVEPVDSTKNTPIQLTIGSTSININGKSNQAYGVPYIQNGRTMISIRDLGTILKIPQSSIRWDGKKKQVYVEYEQTKIVLTINQKECLINDKKVIFEVPATLKQGRVYIPIGLLARELKIPVKYNNTTKEVIFY